MQFSDFELVIRVQMCVVTAVLRIPIRRHMPAQQRFQLLPTPHVQMLQSQQQRRNGIPRTHVDPELTNRRLSQPEIMLEAPHCRRPPGRIAGEDSLPNPLKPSKMLISMPPTAIFIRSILAQNTLQHRNYQYFGTIARVFAQTLVVRFLY